MGSLMAPCDYVQVEMGKAQSEGGGEWNGEVRVSVSATAQVGAATLFICETVILVPQGTVLCTIYIISDPDRNEGMVFGGGANDKTVTSESWWQVTEMGFIP